MTVEISSTVQLAVGTPCIFIGAVLMLSSLAVNEKSKGGFIAMIALGAVLFILGFVVLFLPVAKTSIPPPPTPLYVTSVQPSGGSPTSENGISDTNSLLATEPRSLMESSALKHVPPSALLQRSVFSPSTASTKNGSIRWKDDDKLESVKEFTDEESPMMVAKAQEQLQAAHEPKPVPAVPFKRLVTRLGYESASAPVMPNSELYMADSFQSGMQTDSPLSGGYTRLVPLSDTVETRLRERQEFEAFRDSDTLEAQKHRRYALLREAAWSQPLISRDGLIPIIGPNGEDLTQGRCNAIEANSI